MIGDLIQKTMFRNLAIWFSLVVVGNAVLAFFGRGSAEQFMLHLGCWLGATLIFFLSFPVWFFAHRYEWERTEKVARWVLIVVALGYSTVLAFIIGSPLAKRDIRSGVGFCEALAPKLEEFRKAHQSYPERLDQLDAATGQASLPEILFAPFWWGAVRTHFYRPSPDLTSFRFEFRDPRFISEWITYDSTRPGWWRHNSDSSSPFRLN